MAKYTLDINEKEGTAVLTKVDDTTTYFYYLITWDRITRLVDVQSYDTLDKVNEEIAKLGHNDWAMFYGQLLGNVDYLGA